MQNVNTEVSKSKYLKVSELGSRYGLSFSSHLRFGNKIIALDGIRKCLLVVENGNDSTQSYVIDLNKVSDVTIRNSYGSIRPGELKTKGIVEFLKRIDLQFQFQNNSDRLVLPFYDNQRDRKRNRTRLARNAKNWQMILSKMIGRKVEGKTESETGYPISNYHLSPSQNYKRRVIMQQQKSGRIGNIMILLFVLINAIAIEQGFVANQNWYLLLIVTVPLLVLSIVNIR